MVQSRFLAAAAFLVVLSAVVVDAWAVPISCDSLSREADGFYLCNSGTQPQYIQVLYKSCLGCGDDSGTRNQYSCDTNLQYDPLKPRCKTNFTDVGYVRYNSGDSHCPCDPNLTGLQAMVDAKAFSDPQGGDTTTYYFCGAP